MKDPALRRCSHAARGFWIDLICLMFECEDRGCLSTGGEPWSDDEIAAAISGDTSSNLDLLRELLLKGACSRNSFGAVFSKRMARDESIRQKRVKSGRKGGRKRPSKREAKHQQITESENEVETEIEISSRRIPPPVEAVRAYCRQKSSSINPEEFWNYYESKGWMIGKNRMKNWHAAIANWERNDSNRPAMSPQKPLFRLPSEIMGNRT